MHTPCIQTLKVVIVKTSIGVGEVCVCVCMYACMRVRAYRTGVDWVDVLFSRRDSITFQGEQRRLKRDRGPLMDEGNDAHCSSQRIEIASDEGDDKASLQATPAGRLASSSSSLPRSGFQAMTPSFGVDSRHA